MAVSQPDFDFEFARGGHLLAKFVGLLCNRYPSEKDVESPFRLDHEAPLSLTEFGTRLETYFSCSSSCLVVAAALLIRVKNVRTDIFDWHSTHKLLLAALTVATKMSEDMVCDQDHYAKCGGIEKDELSHLERTFFSLLSYNAFVTEEEFQGAVRVLKSMRAIRLQPPIVLGKHVDIPAARTDLPITVSDPMQTDI